MRKRLVINRSSVLLSRQLTILSLIGHSCIALLAAAVETNEDKRDGDPSNDADNHSVPESVALSFVTLFFFILKSICDVLSDRELLRQQFRFRLFFMM